MCPLSRFLSLLFTLAAVATAYGQVSAILTTDIRTIPLAQGGQFTATLTVTIDPGWHIASISQPDGGPVRTEVTLAPKQPFRLAGPVDGPQPHVKQNDAFDMDVETYEGTAVFTLPLDAIADIPAGTRLTVEITYQACTDENCLLPQTDKVSTVLHPAPVTSHVRPAASGWLTDFDEAQQLAERTGRKLLLDFTGSDWCAACIKLEHEVFTTEEFHRFALDYVLVRLDYPLKSSQPADEKARNAALKERYAIKGYPTIILADADGRELKRLVGYDPQAGPVAYLARLAAPEDKP